MTIIRRPLAVIALALLGACSIALLAASRAEAGYPGKIGAIVVSTDFGLASANDEIMTFPPTGGPPFTQLTFDVLGNVEEEDTPFYSGDGKRIVWQGDTDVVGGGDREIFIMNADGSGQAQLTPLSNTGDNDANPALSWDGKRVVFDRDEPSATNDDEVFVMNADGSGQTQLTFNETDDNDPVFSRDGKRIYYVSDATGTNEIFVMNADGSGQRQLTSSGATGFSGAPDVSPDDRRITFISDRLDPITDEVWVMNADGSGQTKVTTLPSDDDADRPAFSPDGKRIAFERSSPGGDDEIFAINADGSGLTPLTGTPDDTIAAPNWQPIPVNCGGRQATLVGTEGADTIVGTAAADVIAGLGGKDKLSGLGGKDRLCGGKGKDTLKGGGGNDRLFGQAGKDKLKAGKGKKDSCSGGKGNDTGAGCEKEKSI